MDPIVAAELKLVNARLRQPNKYGPTVIPLLLAGAFDTSFRPLLEDVIGVDLRDEAFYFVRLFELIWRLHELSFDNPLLDELRASMEPRER